MFALISRLNAEGLSILLVEQNVVQSLAIAHRAYVLEGGRIALSGKASRARRASGIAQELPRSLNCIPFLPLADCREGEGETGRPASPAAQPLDQAHWKL